MQDDGPDKATPENKPDFIAADILEAVSGFKSRTLVIYGRREEYWKVNILIVKLSAIGDVIHTLPSLAALRKLYPDAHITWVVEEAAADLVKNHPYLDAVLISRRKSWIKDFQRGEIRPLMGRDTFLLKTCVSVLMIWSLIFTAC